jgi:ammonia channel protein AmtB
MSGELTIRATVGTTVVELRGGMRALYRALSLGKRNRNTAAFDRVWAMLDYESAEKFPTPEHLADALTSVEQLADAVKAAAEAEAAASSKNAVSSTPKPSPASS